MAKVKFYALVCRNIKAVVRHVRTVAKEDLVIVINSLDQSFVSDASTYCSNNGIEYYITESDGGPSKGKNSVLDLFEASDNDYMVLIDGDDFLTPHGYWTYKRLAEMVDPPDVVALEYQYGIRREEGYHQALASVPVEAARSPILGVADDQNPDKIHGYGCRVFLQNISWWEQARAGDLYDFAKRDDLSVEFNEVHTRWATHCYKYISNWESHLRLVWFSKTATTGNRFDLSFKIGEDTLFYLQLKKQFLDGKFVMRHLFDRYPTYVYDCRVNGIVTEEKDAFGEDGTEYEGVLVFDYGWFKWLKKLAEEYDSYEEQGIMVEEDVPRLCIKTISTDAEPTNQEADIIWPEGYKPDLMGLVNFPSTTKVFF